jgi:probable F420-dependent oxidoreductase
MQFCFSATFSSPEELVPLARAGDEHGWSTLTISDHLLNPVQTRLAAVTQRLRFLTTVYILPARPPVHVAKQVGTAAVLSGNRVDLGIGIGWMEEEFDAMGVPFRQRGKRTDEMLEVLRALWTGEVVEHHGELFDVPPLEMLPAPTAPVPVYVGGTSEAALRRAARNDGWVSDLHTIEELASIRQRLDRYREEYGRADLPFAVFGSARDAWDLDGYRRVHEAGVTHLVTMPWYFYAGADADLAGKLEGIERFAADVIARW